MQACWERRKLVVSLINDSESVDLNVIAYWKYWGALKNAGAWVLSPEIFVKSGLQPER
jgi:hypothetical protein